MHLGFCSVILGDQGFEEVIKTASQLGLQTIEFACWPSREATRRYAGVCHIDAGRIISDEAYYHEVTSCVAAYQVRISSLAYYPNMMDSDMTQRNENITHLRQVILASERLGVGLVTTFLGRMQDKTVEENLYQLPTIWIPILQFAREHGVRIAIENCPMLFEAGQWPGGQNIMTSPDNWRKIFHLLPDTNLGINYDPSHFVWQMMDYIQPLYEFRERIWHVHCKDVKIDREKLSQVGTMAYPLAYMSPKLPGLGDVEWGRFISALTDIGYHGPVCIEVEDRAFEYSTERIVDSLRLSKRYLEQFIV